MKRSPLRRSFRRRDPVTPEMYEAVMRRDGQCVLAKRDRSHECRDEWGYPHASTDLSRLTIEHVKDEPRMGSRASSDLAHMVALCAAANVGVPSKAERAWMREYLAEVTA